MNNLVMFLAKTWKTVNGKRYEAWVLKKGMWDKERKRHKQVYLAYIGKSRRISIQKARQICEKLGITLQELRKVKRLTLVEESQPAVHPEYERVESPLALPIPMMISELRRSYGLGQTIQDYQVLAMRIGVLHINADQLRLAESERYIPTRDQQNRIQELWMKMRKEQSEDGVR
jgi:hypothetical protein